MHVLQKHHIVDLFVWIDDLDLKRPKPLGGRPSILSDSEVLTILIWDGLTEPKKNLKSIYGWIKREYSDCFPCLPKYQNFVAHCHKLLPLLVTFIQLILANSSEIVFADSTMLPVCRLVRADRHKVAKDVAQFGMNHQGWHYGFKLHAAVNASNQLTAIVFTPANEHDNQHMESLVNEHTNILVGDSHYGAKVMGKRLWKKYRTLVIAPPHHTQKKKIATDWQNQLLDLRPKVEAVFGELKEKAHLVTSYPRSVKGYFLHYLRVLVGYQMGRVS